MKKLLMALLCILGVTGLAAAGIGVAYCSSDEAKKTIDGFISSNKNKVPQANNNHPIISDDISSNFADYNILLFIDNNNMFASNKTTGGIFNYNILDGKFSLLYDRDIVFDMCIVTTHGNYIFLSSNSTQLVVYFTAEDLFKLYELEDNVDDIELKDLGNSEYVAKLKFGDLFKFYWGNTNTGENVELPNVDGEIEKVERVDKENIVITTSANAYKYNTTTKNNSSMLPSNTNGASNVQVTEYPKGSSVTYTNSTGNKVVAWHDKETGQTTELVTGNFGSCEFEKMDDNHYLLICKENEDITYYYVTLGETISCKLVEFPADSVRVEPQDGEVYIINSTIGYGTGWYNLATGELIWEIEPLSFNSEFLTNEKCVKSLSNHGIYIISCSDDSLLGCASYNKNTGEIAQLSSEGYNWQVSNFYNELYKVTSENSEKDYFFNENNSDFSEFGFTSAFFSSSCCMSFTNGSGKDLRTSFTPNLLGLVCVDSNTQEVVKLLDTGYNWNCTLKTGSKNVYVASCSTSDVEYLINIDDLSVTPVVYEWTVDFINSNSNFRKVSIGNNRYIVSCTTNKLLGLALYNKTESTIQMITSEGYNYEARLDHDNIYYVHSWSTGKEYFLNIDTLVLTPIIYEFSEDFINCSFANKQSVGAGKYIVSCKNSKLYGFVLYDENTHSITSLCTNGYNWQATLQSENVYHLVSTYVVDEYLFNVSTSELTKVVYEFNEDFMNSAMAIKFSIGNNKYLVTSKTNKLEGVMLYDETNASFTEVLASGYNYTMSLIDNNTCLLECSSTRSNYIYDIATGNVTNYTYAFDMTFLSSSKAVKSEVGENKFIVSSSSYDLQGVAFYDLNSNEITKLSNSGTNWTATKFATNKYIVKQEHGSSTKYLFDVDTKDFSQMTETWISYEYLDVLAINDTHSVIHAYNYRSDTKNSYLVCDTATMTYTDLVFLNADGTNAFADGTLKISCMSASKIDDTHVLFNYNDYDGSSSVKGTYFLSLNDSLNATYVNMPSGSNEFVSFVDSETGIYSSWTSGQGLFKLNYRTGEKTIMYENTLNYTYSDRPNDYRFMSSNNGNYLVYLDMHTFAVTEYKFDVQVMATSSDIANYGDGQWLAIGSKHNSTTSKYDIYLYVINAQGIVSSKVVETNTNNSSWDIRFVDSNLNNVIISAGDNTYYKVNIVTGEFTYIFKATNNNVRLIENSDTLILRDFANASWQDETTHVDYIYNRTTGEIIMPTPAESEQ